MEIHHQVQDIINYHLYQNLEIRHNLQKYLDLDYTQEFHHHQDQSNKLIFLKIRRKLQHNLAFH